MPTVDNAPDDLTRIIADAIHTAGGWQGFDAFMSQALYTPGLGYYANDLPKFGKMPHGVGSDFVTAPELSPLFGEAVAQQLAQILSLTGSHAVWEFGAGTGALAEQILDALGDRIGSYTIVDLSDTLKQRQQERLRKHAPKVHWVTELPTQLCGAVLGNEVLDAMPVQLLARRSGRWYERGVGYQGGQLVWVDKPTMLRPSVDIEGDHDYVTEIHLQSEAFVRTLADRLVSGVVLLLDYGFPEAEYYHPQRAGGTVMCHRAHRADTDPLRDVGLKDITAHVNFTGTALAAQDAGLEVLGYTSQAHFLMNCGLVQAMQSQPLPQRVHAQKLLMEHEMGELFKVIALGRGVDVPLLGFVHGDRTHRL